MTFSMIKGVAKASWQLDDITLLFCREWTDQTRAPVLEWPLLVIGLTGERQPCTLLRPVIAPVAQLGAADRHAGGMSQRRNDRPGKAGLEPTHRDV
ncbi:MAG: hypothetical protein D6720_11190 [Gammaproteobacteria bacterium]|nr:MAG: hypothetical protein D6720_11190 [Gammaproteobacteria bacterium]